MLSARLFGHDLERATALIRDPKVVAELSAKPDDYVTFVSTASHVSALAGQYSEAYRFLTAWLEKEKNLSSEGTLARFASLVGDTTAAHSIGLEALNMATAEGAGSNIAIDMILLADAAARLGDEMEALDWLSRALRMTRSLREPELEAVVQQTAADIALRHDLPKIALLLLDQAIITTSELTWASNGAGILLQYGRAFDQLHQPQTAMRIYSAAAELAKSERGTVYITAQSLRAELAERGGDLGAAMALVRDAFETILDGRSRIGQESYKLSFITTSQNVADQYFQLLVAAKTPARDIFAAVEAWHLQVFKDIHPAQVAARVPPAEVADELSKILGENEAYVAYSIGEKNSFAVLVDRENVAFIPLRLKLDSLNGQLSEVTRWLDASEPRARAFIRRDIVPAELEGALRSLYDELIEPLALKSKVDHVLISPDESLGAIPWGALLAPANSPVDTLRRWAGFSALRPVADTRATAVVLSAQLLLAGLERNNVAPKGGLGLVGAFERVDPSRLDISGPSFSPSDHGPARELPALRHGVEEIVAIRDAIRGMPVTILLDEASAQAAKDSTKRLDNTTVAGIASRDAVLALMPKVSFLHISGHAVFDRAVPMQSRLFLSPAAGGAASSNDVLTAEDFLTADLAGNRLAVLSACETGRGQIATGNEVFGFLRGLMAAGAQSVVLTRWSVDDTATAELFAKYYRHLANKKPLAEALRIAQSEVFRARRHPFYWAAPTLFGWWR